MLADPDQLIAMLRNGEIEKATKVSRYFDMTP